MKRGIRVPTEKHIEAYCRRSYAECEILNMMDSPDENDESDYLENDRP
jgi:hypothetical protein